MAVPIPANVAEFAVRRNRFDLGIGDAQHDGIFPGIRTTRPFDREIRFIVNFDRIHAQRAQPRRPFAAPEIREIFERYKRRQRRRKYRVSQGVSAYQELSPGDFVVHVNYGIARYLGIQQIQVEESEIDCLQLMFAGGDKIYVTIDQLTLDGNVAPGASPGILSVTGNFTFATGDTFKEFFICVGQAFDQFIKWPK